MLTAPCALKSSALPAENPASRSRGFRYCGSQTFVQAAQPPSKEKIGDLIERVKNLNAHDDERCDHQIETKMHCDLCSKAFMRHARLRGPGTKLMSYWR
jgi:uncharacterized Zn-finger protein